MQGAQDVMAAQSSAPAPVLPPVAPRTKSPEARERQSISSVGSAESFSAKPRSPSPKSKPIAPLPEIQITRTESNRSTVDEKWIKPRDLDDDNGNRI